MVRDGTFALSKGFTSGVSPLLSLPMTTSSPQVRRATVDDLSKLVPMWKQENLPWEDFEKRFKEFQVMEGPEGAILGALGLQVTGTEASLHSEVIGPADQADAIREKIWGRVQILAKNHGLVRLWTQLDAPFWSTHGFNTPGAEVLPKLPAAFGLNPQPWRFLQIRDETGPAANMEKEFAVFLETERDRTQRLLQQAKVLKFLAALVALGLLGLVLVWAVFFFRLKGRHPGP